MSWEVHLEWQGKTCLVGRLHTSERSPTVSFEYATEWLAGADAFAIDPTSLPLQAGPLHSPVLFGGIQDCGPDRWGRVLIERAVRKGVLDRKPFSDFDYVLALDDATRLGALRFRRDAAGPFLAVTSGRLPPLIRLRALLHSSDAIHSETDTAADLRFLLGAGSPLGGARPKAAISLPDGRLALAKFPKPDDIRDIAAGEILALTLAAQAGIRIVEHQLVSVGGRSVSVIARFDRADGCRIPFLSAASILGLVRGEAGAYTMLADAIRQFGYDVQGDLQELWRRLIFSLLASNYDDHMRNHGFLMRKPGQWALSPAYDINPTPEIDRVHLWKTPISEETEKPTIAEVLEVARRFGLDASAARSILREVFNAVSGWRQAGRKLRLKAATLTAYASAFEHELTDEARRLLAS
ncbi:MAG: type II toxin-antitoxin system HipA family toxin [Verrucomicrobia bacterium]|nr:MAG: type II toxin-antitoxin system HipA family toxin [Verrucomicrobiota bacterium]